MARLIGRRGMWLVCVALGMAGGTAARAQEPAVKLPSFDVVSVKPNNTGSGSIRMSMSSDHFQLTNATVAMMIQNAYGLKPNLLFNLPPWATSQHFDVQGKVIDPDMKLLDKLTAEQRRPMYQEFLKERFGLVCHMETKELPVFEMVVTKGGAKMAVEPPADPKAVEDKNQRLGRGGVMTNGDASGFHMEAKGVKMATLANMLSGQTGRTVVDKTGLTGEYSFKLQWAPEEGTGRKADPAAEALPSIFTAVQEELGLRLVASKGDVETLVVDHLEMPSEN